MKKRIWFLIVTMVLMNVDICWAKSARTNLKTTPITLEKALGRALKNSPRIQKSKLDQVIARYQIPIVKSRYDTYLSHQTGWTRDHSENDSTILGDESRVLNSQSSLAKKLPTGSTIQVSHTENRVSTNSPVAIFNKSFQSQKKIGVEQPLLKNAFGLIDRGEVNMVKLDVENINASAQDEIETVVFDVIQTYWTVYFYHMAVKEIKDAIKRAEELQKNLNTRLESGLLEKPDVLDGEANILNFQDLLDDTIRELREFSTRLEVLLGENVRGVYAPNDKPKLNRKLKSLDENLEIAFDKRRDYNSTLRQIEKQNIQIVISKNQRWPELNLLSSLAFSGFDDDYGKALGQSLSFKNPEVFVGLKASIPLENRAARYSFKQENERGAQLVYDLKQIEMNIKKDVEDAHQSILSYETIVTRYKKLVAVQNEKLSEGLRIFSEGRSSTSDIVDYQNDLARSRVDLVENTTRYLIAYAALERSQNILLPNLSYLAADNN